MGTWRDVCTIAVQFGARQLNDTGWLFELQGAAEDRTQKVFVSYELMQPDFEFVQIKSPFAPMRDVDVARTLKSFGQLNAGAIGYSPIYDSDGRETDGFLNITTSIPLRSLDLSDPTPFLLHLHILARAADNLERNLSSMGPVDAF
jgi:hypothetical protein